MPSSAQILSSLQAIVDDALPVAVGWHLLAGAALIALLAGWRPPRRRAAALLAAPIVSAAILALSHGNPFNGVLLGALALALLGLASRIGAGTVRRGSAASVLLGLGMIGFGWVYPHFLAPRPAVLYLFAAPAGLIPCPTLSLVIGFGLLAGGFGSRAWSVTLAAVALFYGLFGVVRLGVRLDAGLLAGAVALLAIALDARARLRRARAQRAEADRPAIAPHAAARAAQP